MNTQTSTKDLQKTERKAARKAKEPKTVEQAVVPAPEAQSTKAKRGLAATMAKYRAGYVDGKSCGDAVASRLAGMSLEAVIAEAEQVSGLKPGALIMKYAGLNLGQQRMCAGNRIRAAAKKAEKAMVAEIAALLQKA